MTEAIAPGKLILSGEHAVVHGCPAVAMAVNRYAKARVAEPQTPSLVSFDFLNLRYQQSMTLKALRRLKRRLLSDHQSFLAGKRAIHDVLKLPFELSQFALTNLLDKSNRNLPQGMALSTHSDIPIGCGMGSSAAMILCVQYAVAHHLDVDIPGKHHLHYGIEAENLQHGKSSGLDLQVSLKGGALYYENQQTYACPTPVMPMYVVNTGQRLSTSGECVNHAAHYFQQTQLHHDFSRVTQQVIKALQQQSLDDMICAIRENHRLLTYIGVVPQKIQDFIRDIEQQGGSGKICGAGAIRGNNAGMVLIFSEKNPRTLCEKYGYTAEILEGDTRGLHIN